MDPLVRASLAVQQGVGKILGAVVSLGAGAYLVYWALDPPPAGLNLLVLGVVLASLAVRVRRRVRCLATQSTARLDLEIFSHCIALTYAGVLHAPGKLEGPYYAAVYVVIMLAAGFARPLAATGSIAFAILLEASIGYVALGDSDGETLWPHAGLIGVFALLNMAIFHAEIARVRRLSRSRIEGELRRMKEAARSYRLVGAPSPALSAVSAGDRAADDDRLLSSGVDEIHEALRFAMALLRESLKLQTAALLWLDPSGKRLHIQEILTDHDVIASGPFDVRDGILAAALAQGRPVSLVGPAANRHAPYYSASPGVGALLATPVLENGHARGVLVVDRREPDPFTSQEEELIVDSTGYLLRAVQNERVFLQLERTKIEQSKLYRAVGALSAAASEAEVMEACVGSAREFTSFDFAAVTLLHRSSAEHEICAVSGQGAEHLAGQRFPHNSGLVSMVVANRHALPYRGDHDPERQVVFTSGLRTPPMPSLLVLPLTDRDRALGTLVLGSRRRGAFGSAVRPTLEVLASHVAVSLSNARMVRRLEELATTDGLTGLLNKRALQDAALQKLRSANRFNRQLAVMIVDLDLFKRVNDVYGHDIGDVVIKGLSSVLQRAKRTTDVVGRFGGEEFVVVCEETDAHGAALLAERVRVEMAETRFHTELGSLNVTCSIGIATRHDSGSEWEALFKAADEALYASKRGGRNRVTAWTPRCSGCAA
jgi:two-component system cell cycle response regulator